MGQELVVGTHGEDGYDGKNFFQVSVEVHTKYRMYAGDTKRK